MHLTQAASLPACTFQVVLSHCEVIESTPQLSIQDILTFDNETRTPSTMFASSIFTKKAIAAVFLLVVETFIVSPTFGWMLPVTRHNSVGNYRVARRMSSVVLGSKRPREYTEEEQRLLLTEPAVAAYVRAEVSEWLMENNLVSNPTVTERNAVADIAQAVEEAYMVASQQDILSNHGALLSFLQTELRNNNIGNRHKFSLAKTTPYQVAKRGVDVLHHRLYRGTYTKTITPTGAGEIAAREAVGLSASTDTVGGRTSPNSSLSDDNDDDEGDNCLVEPPVELQQSVDCLWTENDQAEWRNRRFEKITMEGWRDPRRGNSGTSR